MNSTWRLVDGAAATPCRDLVISHSSKHNPGRKPLHASPALCKSTGKTLWLGAIWVQDDPALILEYFELNWCPKGQPSREEQCQEWFWNLGLSIESQCLLDLTMDSENQELIFFSPLSTRKRTGWWGWGVLANTTEWLRDCPFISRNLTRNKFKENEGHDETQYKGPLVEKNINEEPMKRGKERYSGQKHLHIWILSKRKQMELVLTELSAWKCQKVGRETWGQKEGDKLKVLHVDIS